MWNSPYMLGFKGLIARPVLSPASPLYIHRDSSGYKGNFLHKEYVHGDLLGDYLVFTSSGIHLLDLSPYGGSILGLPMWAFVRASKVSRTGPRVNPESIPPTLAPKIG